MFCSALHPLNSRDGNDDNEESALTSSRSSQQLNWREVNEVESAAVISCNSSQLLINTRDLKEGSDESAETSSSSSNSHNSSEVNDERDASGDSTSLTNASSSSHCAPKCSEVSEDRDERGDISALTVELESFTSSDVSNCRCDKPERSSSAGQCFNLSEVRVGERQERNDKSRKSMQELNSREVSDRKHERTLSCSNGA